MNHNADHITQALLQATRSTFTPHKEAPRKLWITEATLSLLTKERGSAVAGNYLASRYFKKQARKQSQKGQSQMDPRKTAE